MDRELALEWASADEAARRCRCWAGDLARAEARDAVAPATGTCGSGRQVRDLQGRLVAFRQLADKPLELGVAGSVWVDSGHVFTTAHGQPCDPRNALRALKVTATKAELGHVGLHTLRHSAASVMITNGIPLKVVSEILGHSSIAITGDVYRHVSPDVSAQAMDSLSEALRS